MKRILIGCITLLLIAITPLSHVNAQEDPVNDAKSGIIEIYSGIRDNAGRFCKLKNGSGVVIAIQEDKAYILTNQKILSSTSKSKKAYCKENGMSYDSIGTEDVIYAVIEGDVTTEATILTSSKKQNYAILMLEYSNIEKTPIPLGDSSELVTGSGVYTLGFSKTAGEDDNATDRHTKFTAFDVEISAGIVEDTNANQDGIVYLQHSAMINKGNTGGALIDADGYLVGINNSSLTEDDSVYYSLPINEMKVVLQSFNVPYESKERNLLLDELSTSLKEAEDMLAGKLYKAGSKEKLQAAVESVKSTLSEPVYDMGILSEAAKSLEDGKASLELKMKTSRKIIIALGGILIFMVAWLLKLFIEKKGRAGKKVEKKKVEAPIANTVQESAKQSRVMERVLEVQEEEAFQGSGETVYLPFGNKKQSMDLYLVIKETGKRVKVDKDTFIIGKKESVVDLLIEGNRAVSRQHAVIESNKGEYYIMDCNSANGTFLNGEQVTMPQMLSDGDELILANEVLYVEIH